MATVAECIEKQASSGAISRARADEALAFFQRSQTEFSMQSGPASAAAAAAVETAKKMRTRAANMQIAIAADVSRYQTIERRIMEDPRGRNAALAGVLTKDTIQGGADLEAFRKANPDHPIFADGNADYRASVVKDKLYGMLGNDLDKYATGFMADAKQMESSRNFIRERFGINTGDSAAKQVSDGFGKVIDYAAARAKAAGKVFTELEDWRVFQHWEPSRVARVTPDQYVKDYMAEISNGGLKLFDQETNRYATAARYDELLRKAHSDIKTEGGNQAPFSKEMRTFEFQPGQAGSDSWLKLQAKYGVGNEIMGTVGQHVEHMARTIALHETFGGHPDAVFAAALRLVKDDPTPPVKGLGWLTSARTLENTYKNISGRGSPVASEMMARFFSGMRDLVGAASLRNLPVTIIPGDTAMTQLAARHLGMDPFRVMSEVLNSGLTKDEAAHLQVSAHSYMDYINNTVRKYEDQINVSGLIRKVSRGVVKATGAELWTTNGRQGWQSSMLNQLASVRDKAFGDLDQNMQRNFLGRYGFTPADWDAIRQTPTFDAHNGAKYLDPTAIDPKLSERLMAAIKEQGSYAFHQPDARTAAIMHAESIAGTASGEFWRSVGQYKQFTMERMTTHMMRILVDGPMESRVDRGLAFTLLSMAAGAVSIQTAAVLSGKDPLDMISPGFWVQAFIRGGAGGIYGDVLNSALHGDRNRLDMAGELAGPVPGFISDSVNVLAAPFRQATDPSGRRSVADTFKARAFDMGKRWTPQTWYTKLAVDRMLWDKLQTLTDPNFRQSFVRSQQYAQKQGTNFWFPPGTNTPARAPNLGNAFGR